MFILRVGSTRARSRPACLEGRPGGFLLCPGFGVPGVAQDEEIKIRRPPSAYKGTVYASMPAVTRSMSSRNGKPPPCALLGAQVCPRDDPGDEEPVMPADRIAKPAMAGPNPLRSTRRESRTRPQDHLQAGRAVMGQECGHAHGSHHGRDGYEQQKKSAASASNLLQSSTPGLRANLGAGCLFGPESGQLARSRLQVALNSRGHRCTFDGRCGQDLVSRGPDAETSKTARSWQPVQTAAVLQESRGRSEAR